MLVYFSGKDEFKHNHEFDWRFTFASAEADLFHYHRDKKALKLCSVVLKFLIKNSISRSVGLGHCCAFYQVCIELFSLDLGICVTHSACPCQYIVYVMYSKSKLGLKKL